jgi:GNAT superfamily N-acetyltransferase
MENFIYKQATEADIPMIIDQRVIFANELGGKQDTQTEAMQRKDLTDYFQRELNKTYICWYATLNDEVVAIGGLVIRTQPGNIKNPSGIWGYIMNIYTRPQDRRKGLSTEILNRLIGSARERGIVAFELHATKEGEQVYIKDGFELHPEPTYRKFIK